ncbi:MAG: hypothetical protein A2580_09180 [Hydrogenophilales bacterium RIFOXYD1_FULL_62_11]|nr:MAG: hypothetical protein A2580_09180 [Hydrogenophilales bacterium RIFOXYD1_FULL_62_11]
MRGLMTQAIALNQERKRLRQQLKKTPDDATCRDRLDETTDRLLDMLVQELTHQSRDISAAAARGRRHY